MSKVYNPALQERLESYLANSGISQAKLAPKVGISQTALSQYRRSKYDNGDIAELERKLEEFFRTEEAVEAAAVKAAPYVDIEVLNENFRKIDASASSLEVTLRIEADETTVVAVSHSSGTYSGISTFSCAISSGSVSPSFTSFFSPATVINIFFLLYACSLFKVILQSSCLTLPVSVLLFSGLSPVRL